MAVQNADRCSRERLEGRPGDFISPRISCTAATACFCVTFPTSNTHFNQVLRPPVESAQFTSIRYGERLDEIGARPSIGSIGDSFDNALAESVNALYKTELMRGPGRGPWKTIDDLELQPLAWVHWHNNERLHSYLGDFLPVEFDAIYNATVSETSLVELKS